MHTDSSMPVEAFYRCGAHEDSTIQNERHGGRAKRDGGNGRVHTGSAGPTARYQLMQCSAPSKTQTRHSGLAAHMPRDCRIQVVVIGRKKDGSTATIESYMPV